MFLSLFLHSWENKKVVKRVFDCRCICDHVFSAVGLLRADVLTFGVDDLDRLDLAGPQMEGDFTYTANAGVGWELQSVFAVDGVALVTFFNVEGSGAGDSVEFMRTDGGLFTFDSVDFSTISASVSDEVLFSGFLDGNLVDTLLLDFSNSGSFITVPAAFSGPLDVLTLEVTFAGNNAAIFDNLVLTGLLQNSISSSICVSD